MKLYPEDYRYWIGWLILMIIARFWLVQPIINAIKESHRWR